jgi:glutaredoxin
VRDLEAQVAAAGGDRADAAATVATDVTGQTTVFGARPRLLIMAEESGGAAMGPVAPMISRHGNRSALAAKEKDAMQVGIAALALAARLHNDGGSFAAYYLDQLETYRIGYRFYERRDVTLFDESLQGEARARAQVAGNARKDATVAFFAALAGADASAAASRIAARLPAGVELPPVQRVVDAGDGTLIEFAQQWFELRASGTDAVLRYYMEGLDGESVSRLNEAMTLLSIEDTESVAVAERPYETLTVYSATWCPDCRQAKRFLEEHGVRYDLIEIDEDEEAAARLEAETGKRGIPYFVLDGERWVRAYIPKQGFDREGMKKLLGLR